MDAVDTTSTALFRTPGSHQPRRKDRRGQERSPAERYVLDQLITERNQLRETLDNVRDLADRVMARSEEKDERIIKLEAQIRAKDEMIAALEAENDQLIRQLSARETRISTLESFLEMISEAEKRG
ncbi:MAG: hypothetical protein ACT4TC_23345 [Myxococcaceae bacterium]